MYWRLRRSEWEAGCRDGRNRQALEALVASGQVPGLLGYVEGRPVGWISVAPREQYGALERSRVFRRIDREPVWAVVCFYVAKGYRRRGVALALLQGAVEWVRTRGGRVIEGYPIDPGRKVRDAHAYMGTVPLFRRAGFVEVARTANGRPVMRYYLDGLPSAPSSLDTPHR